MSDALSAPEILGTGHTVGVTYAGHPGEFIYRVVGAGKFHQSAVRAVINGRLRDYIPPIGCTDHPVTDECPMGICRKRITN